MSKKETKNCLKFTMNKNPFVDLSELAENQLIPCFAVLQWSYRKSNKKREVNIMENQTTTVKEFKEAIWRMLAGINSRADLLRIKRLVQYIYYKR